MIEDVACPFCKKNGFDLIGLKHHLENYCEQYQGILSIEEEAALRKIKQAIEVEELNNDNRMDANR